MQNSFINRQRHLRVNAYANATVAPQWLDHPAESAQNPDPGSR